MQALLEFMISFGYKPRNIEKILSNNSVKLVSYEYILENIKSIIKYLVGIRYTKEEIIRITTKEPTLVTYMPLTLNQKIATFINLNYMLDDILMMFKKQPVLLTMSSTNIINTFIDLVNLGFSKEEVISMTKNFPTLFEYDIENVKDKINNLLLKGYSKDEIMDVSKKFPAILGLSKDNINEKLDFFETVGLQGVALKKPDYTVQSVEVTYARYEFFRMLEVEITSKNINKLFVTAKCFQESYGVSKQELLEMHNYERDYKNNTKRGKN